MMIKENKKELVIKKVHNAIQTRKKILEAAKKSFFEKSYENVALRQIATDSGIFSGNAVASLGNQTCSFSTWHT